MTINKVGLTYRIKTLSKLSKDIEKGNPGGLPNIDFIWFLRFLIESN